MFYVFLIFFVWERRKRVQNAIFSKEKKLFPEQLRHDLLPSEHIVKDAKTSEKFWKKKTFSIQINMWRQDDTVLLWQIFFFQSSKLTLDFAVYFIDWCFSLPFDG
jgi:hypothetical protein